MSHGQANYAANNVNLSSASTWVLIRPTLQRRSALRGFGWLPTVSDLTPKQAWYAFQTIRRWHESGRAARVVALERAWVDGGMQVGSIERFRFIESAGEEVGNIGERPVQP